MELIINNNKDNYFKVRGVLVKLNVHLFDAQFADIFDGKNNITINITELNKIDSYGVNAIAKLHNEAISRNKRLSVIGLGNQDLFSQSYQEKPKETMMEKFAHFCALLIMPFVDA